MFGGLGFIGFQASGLIGFLGFRACRLSRVSVSIFFDF